MKNKIEQYKNYDKLYDNTDIWNIVSDILWKVNDIQTLSFREFNEVYWSTQDFNTFEVQYLYERIKKII